MSRHESRREADYRKHVPDASPVRTAAGRAQADDPSGSKPASQPRGENTSDRLGRMSAHSGFVRPRRETRRFLFPFLLPTRSRLPPCLKGRGLHRERFDGAAAVPLDALEDEATDRQCSDNEGDLRAHHAAAKRRRAAQAAVAAFLPGGGDHRSADAGCKIGGCSTSPGTPSPGRPGFTTGGRSRSRGGLSRGFRCEYR